MNAEPPISRLQVEHQPRRPGYARRYVARSDPSLKTDKMTSLPTFKYHPDPLDTGNVVQSDIECVCCGKQRGYIYTGPVYAVEEYDNEICPWCIADGTAHEKLDAEFHDSEGVPGWAFMDCPEVSEDIIEEICWRTPGFAGWQQEQWATCCDDAAAFLGRAGHKELNERWPGAIEAIQDSTGLDDAEWTSFFRALQRAGAPTAYVFQCLHCKKLTGYQDTD